jgi:hypothetical protein
VALRPFLSKGVPFANEERSLHGLPGLSIDAKPFYRDIVKSTPDEAESPQPDVGFLQKRVSIRCMDID